MAAKNARKKRRCRKKVSHTSRDNARKALAAYRRSHPFDRRMMTYRCQFCGQWHLGHRSKTHIKQV